MPFRTFLSRHVACSPSIQRCHLQAAALCFAWILPALLSVSNPVSVGASGEPLIGPQTQQDEGASQEESVQALESRFFTDVKQRTLAGLRSGEGYYSADGQKMVFQSFFFY